MTAKIYVVLKPGLLDAQGKTVKGALDALGFRGVQDVRVGKYVEIDLNRPGGAAAAQRDVERMCQKLLANPVIETYRIEIGNKQYDMRSSTLAVGSKKKAR